MAAVVQSLSDGWKHHQPPALLLRQASVVMATCYGAAVIGIQLDGKWAGYSSPLPQISCHVWETAAHSSRGLPLTLLEHDSCVCVCVCIGPCVFVCSRNASQRTFSSYNIMYHSFYTNVAVYAVINNSFIFSPRLLLNFNAFIFDNLYLMLWFIVTRCWAEILNLSSLLQILPHPASLYLQKLMWNNFLRL